MSNYAPRFITPPEMVDTPYPVIFLAGPIQGAPIWQPEAADFILPEIDEATVASPRKDYGPGQFVYEKQVDWESRYLREAGRTGVVLFWLANQAEETPGRSYAQTTRFELGEWKTRHEYEGAWLSVGIDSEFGNGRYIRRRLGQDCPGIPIAETLEEACLNAIELLNRRRIN